MLYQAQELLDRAVLQERGGHWQSAIALYEEAFQKSLDERNAQGLAESVLRIGHAYRQTGDREVATDYLELAFTLGEIHSEPGLSSRALNGLAVLFQTHGELEAAEDTYARAREYAIQAKDVLTTGSIDQNLGTIANIRGNLTRALEHYRSGLSCYEKVSYDRGIALVLNNMGMLHVDLGELEQARICLDRALEVSKRSEDIVSEGIVHTNRTELLLALGDTDAARESCDEAFEISSRLGDNRLKAEALKFYGMIYRESGKTHLAEIHLRQSIGISSKYSDILTEAETQRELALVLRILDRNREALRALNRAHQLFSELRAQRDQADVDKRVLQLEEDFLALVRVWGESIEAKDRYTRGHCQRVADYACRIAEAIGLSERDMVWFRMGAFLHDVGKTEVPEEILNKPGKLTDEERNTMERHTVDGDEMLAPIPFPWDIRPMVRSHHERWDGRGYPDQLKGQEIPLTARILRIADIFDALTTTRSYREPLTPEQARQIMRDDYGSFDPDLFAVFEQLYPEFEQMVGGDNSVSLNAGVTAK